MPCSPSASIRKTQSPVGLGGTVTTPIEVLVPDIGGFKDVNGIDVLVKDGQQIEKEAPLITLESEKAAMDVPAPVSGRITQLKLKQGDKVSEGSLILLLEPAAAEASAAQAAPGASAAPGATPPAAPAQARTATTPAAAAPSVAGTPAPAAAAPPAAAMPAPAAVVPAAAAVAPPPAARADTTIDETAFSKACASPSVR